MNIAAIEAGLLRALETTVYGALVASLQATLPLLSAPTAAAVDWPSVLHTFLSAMLVAALVGLKSYHSAVGDGVGAGPADSSLAPSPAASAAATPSEPSAGI